MSELETISQSIKELSAETKRETAESSRSFREEASKSSEDMYDISKDLANYFATQKESESSLSAEIEESVLETENVARKVEDSNSLLQNSVNIQNQTLVEIGRMNATLENLFTQLPMWLKESGGGVGHGGGLSEILGALGLSSLLKGRKATKNLATGEIESAPESTNATPEPIIHGSTEGKIPSAVVEATEKPSMFGRLGSVFSKGGSILRRGLSAIPLVGDALQGVIRGYESGSVGEGVAAALGSAGGRLVGAGLGGVVAGPIGAFGGEVAGSMLGSQSLADAYRNHFEKPNTNLSTQPSSQQPNSTPTASNPAISGHSSVLPNIQNNSGQYQDGRQSYDKQSILGNLGPSYHHTNISSAVGGGPITNPITPWSPRSTEIMTGTGIIPGVGIGTRNNPGSGMTGSGLENYLGSYGSGFVQSGEREDSSSGGGSHGGSSGDNHGNIGSGKTTIAKGSLAKNQQLAYDAAIKNGLSPSAAKILVANMSGESLASPSNEHWDRTHNSQGIVQWDPQRASRIQKEFGKLPKDMTVAEQTKAAIWEMKTFPKEFPGAYAALTNEKLSESERMYGVVKHYEKPLAAEKDTQTRLGLLHGLRVKETGSNSDGTSVEDNVHGLPAGTPPEITDRLKKMKASGQVNGNECVALAQAAVSDNTNVKQWRKGESAESGKIVPGTPLATYLDRQGRDSDRYAGGGIGTKGAGLDHAVVFENYLKDRQGHITGMHVAEQYATSHGVREKDYMFGKGGGEHNASNYYAIKTEKGGYLGGSKNPMSHHEMADRKPSRPAPPPMPTKQDAPRQMASVEKHDSTSSGGHYGGSDSKMSSKGNDRIRSASLSPSWGDMVKSITGTYGVA